MQLVRNALGLAFAAIVIAEPLSAQAPLVSVEPAQPAPGALVRFTLVDSAAASAIVSARGVLAGEPLNFLAADSGRFHAIGAIPTEASDSLLATVIIQRAAGSADTLRVAIMVPPIEVPTTEPTLAVSTRFTQPLDAKTQARIARENALARDVGRRAHTAPPRWTEAFLKPRDTRITSEFGTGRLFNGKVSSRHLGVDYQGATGTPIVAANRGVVALVDTFFLAGRVVYIDHGGGVVTGYFHMSKPLVKKGDTVERGQRIGLVGATGRVTGPHLHWTARYGGLTMNPGDLLSLDPFVYSARLRRE
jgi:murein DD-endopeptidase MepM/ murein hydrolase activator NlpD